MIKREFYEGTLFNDSNVDCKPQVKVMFNLETDFKSAYRKIAMFLDVMQSTLSRLTGHYFTDKELDDALLPYISKRRLGRSW